VIGQPQHILEFPLALSKLSVLLVGMTGIMKGTRPGHLLVGFPAYPKREWTRLHLSLRKVPELLTAQREP
jgi:hypothetical protein